ncbi:uncharacterized protein LOC121496848 isoform X2 [Vulpes lagopus]|uniref:uncharacterized protein LOC121496848 isoform X2 n=2 Tax=Vulpes lagopus TaxID=494514 RepID=UPI001BC9F469|nr:uncharacterized protein LOC121496848 isoform X2 [Vulpes lagopus]
MKGKVPKQKRMQKSGSGLKQLEKAQSVYILQSHRGNPDKLGSSWVSEKWVLDWIPGFYPTPGAILCWCLSAGVLRGGCDFQRRSQGRLAGELCSISSLIKDPELKKVKELLISTLRLLNMKLVSCK